MNILNKLEELANSLPTKVNDASDLPKPLQDAVISGDSNILKKYLSNDQLNADMTRVTNF